MRFTHMAVGETVLLDVPSSVQRPDGRWEHHLRQSDINRFRQCPELHRRNLLRLAESHQSDAMLVGSATHLGTAQAAEVLRSEAMPILADCTATAVEHLREQWESCRQLTYSSLAEAEQAVAGGMTAFWNDCLPLLAQSTVVGVEQVFDLQVYEDDQRVIFISGTYDLALPDATLDYKTSNGKSWTRDAWKVERYNVQSTVYSWARDLQELSGSADMHSTTLDYEDSALLLPFVFVVLNLKTQATEFVQVQRTVGDCRMLLSELLGMASLIEARLPQWPLRPDDWYCSPVWCEAWSNCRGKYLGDDPWGLLARRLDSIGLSPTAKADEVPADPFAGLPS